MHIIVPDMQIFPRKIAFFSDPSVSTYIVCFGYSEEPSQ